MEWLQQIYIFFLKLFCELSEKLDGKLKLKLIYLVCFLLYGICYIWYTLIAFDNVPTLLSRMIQGVVLIVVLVFLGLEKPLKPIKWNKIFAWSWFVLGMLIFIMGFVSEQNPGYWMSGPVIAFGFPCVYMVYGEKNKYLVIFDALCKSAIIITILYFFASLAGEFIREDIWISGRYNGIAFDCNRVGEMCIVSFSFIMYYINKTDRCKMKYLAVVALGTTIGEVLLTQSRTAMLAIAMILIFYTVVFIKDNIIKSKEKCNRKIVQLGIEILIVLIVSVLSYSAIVNIHEFHVSKIKATDIESEIGTDIDVSDVEGIGDYNRVLPKESTDVNSYSSGRIKIWKTYADEFNLLGNIHDAETSISEDIGSIFNAHNSLIEITYRSGIVTGAVYLLIEILVGLFIVRAMFGNERKHKDGDYLLASNAIAFLIFTNLMPAYNPITAFVYFMFMLTLFPAFTKEG